MAPVIPLAITGVQMYMQHRANKKAEQAAKEAAAPVQQGANALGTQGEEMWRYGNPLLRQSAGYYQKLLNGSRASMMQAINPEVNAIGDTYRGAERGLDRSGVRGPARDLALAELSRERAGKIASLLPAVRPMAAQNLGALGQFGASGGTTATTAGMQGHAGLFNGLVQGQRQRAQDSAGAGTQMGKALADFLGSQKWMPTWGQGMDTDKMPGTKVTLPGQGGTPYP